jgi:hypothetical protein
MATRRGFTVLVLFGVALVGAVAAWASNGSPPRSRTGAPQIYAVAGEGMCVDCHSGSAVNDGGSVQLVSPPASYTPGTTYTLTFQLASSHTAGVSSRDWGFQVTALKATDGTGAGTFANIAGQGTIIGSGTGSYSTRRYVEVDTNDQAGVASPVQWQFQWTAPNPGVGAVNFYFSGVAGNGGGNTSGDWTYKGSQTILDSTTPVVSATWGKVKSRYHTH